MRRHGVIFIFRPIALLSLRGRRAALFSAGTQVDAGHASPGANTVAYLDERGGGLRLRSGLYDVGAAGGFGTAAQRWAVSARFGPDPVLYTEAEDGNQGCFNRFAGLTTLPSDRPHDVADVRIGYSDVAAYDDGRGQAIVGRITSVQPGRSFAVRYQGQKSFVERYVMTRGAYRLRGRSRLPSC